MSKKKKIKINIRPKGNPPNKKASPTPPLPEQKKQSSEEELQRLAREKDEKLRQERARLAAERQAEKKRTVSEKKQEESQKEAEKPPQKQAPKKKKRSTRASRLKAKKAAMAAKAKTKENNSGQVLQRLSQVGFLLFILVAGYFLFKWTDGETPKIPIEVTEKKPSPKVEKVDPKFIKYGLDTRNYKLTTEVPSEDKRLVNVLEDIRIDEAGIAQIRSLAAKKLRPPFFQAERKYTVFEDLESQEPAFLVYEIAPLKYLKFGLGDSLFVETVQRETITKSKSLGFTLAKSLEETFYNKSIDNNIAHDLDLALASTVDLFRMKPGDQFKIYYDEIYADKDKIDAQLLAVYLKTGNKDYYAFWYENGSTVGYFDELARPTKRSFLKSPLDFGRVTSKFGPRTHPVTGKKKDHLGTDFAASEGTPIRALADGKVTIATFKKNNGNYVKINHGKTYDTQYLHMQKFAEGIKAGVTVRQGQTIGYVGSTGLSTGPHVCLRFWKKDRQIDFLNADLPANAPIASRLVRAYVNRKDSLKRILDDMGAN